MTWCFFPQKASCFQERRGGQPAWSGDYFTPSPSPRPAQPSASGLLPTGRGPPRPQGPRGPPRSCQVAGAAPGAGRGGGGEVVPGSERVRPPAHLLAGDRTASSSETRTRLCSRGPEAGGVGSSSATIVAVACNELSAPQGPGCFPVCPVTQVSPTVCSPPQPLLPHKASVCLQGADGTALRRRQPRSARVLEVSPRVDLLLCVPPGRPHLRWKSPLSQVSAVSPSWHRTGSVHGEQPGRPDRVPLERSHDGSQQNGGKRDRALGPAGPDAPREHEAQL